MRPFKIRLATASVRFESLDKVRKQVRFKKVSQKEVGRVADRLNILLRKFIPEKFSPTFASIKLEIGKIK